MLDTTKIYYSLLDLHVEYNQNLLLTIGSSCWIQPKFTTHYWIFITTKRYCLLLDSHGGKKTTA